MLSAWGDFPPAGLFEGTFGSIGSFHGCVNVPQNEAIGHAHYCTIAYRPVLPRRRQFELIVRQEPQQLLRLFPAEHAFSELLQHAQYNHYIYYKLGTCFPIACVPEDVQRLAYLLGRRSMLMSGPVKCHSKHADDYQNSELQISTRDLNQGVYVWKPHTTQAQLVAGAILVTCVLLVALLSLIDVVGNRIPGSRSSRKRARNASQESQAGARQRPADNRPPTQSQDLLDHIQAGLKKACLDENNNVIDDQSPQPSLKGVQMQPLEDKLDTGRPENKQASSLPRSPLLSLAKDYSLLTNVRQFFTINQSQLNNDILCINGIRCLTMTWIIVTHTMQYNDWSAFARTREIETHLKSLVNQPIFNASYLVDTFFLISGLLTSFSSFRTPKASLADRTAGSDALAELRSRFSARNYLLGRYLRLTPQILFVSLLFIVLPKLSTSGGPHWYTMTGEYSENCAQNWWVNLLHIEAFYRPSQMCNFACWWVSVDMLFHLFGLAVILLSLRFGFGLVWRACTLITLAYLAYQAERHFALALPPNLLSTIPQTGAMWTKMTLAFFWTPQAHALPFFLGLYLGYLMAQHGRTLAGWFAERGARGARRRLTGWALAGSALALQSYSTYFWVTGEWAYSRLGATAFQLCAPAVWSASLAWIILACHYGQGGPLNTLLSAKLFLVLGKASYLVYLSHFLVLFTFFGSQNLLLEPTQLMMFYVIVGNVCLSMLLGSVLCIGFELPWLKTQRRLVSRLV